MTTVSSAIQVRPFFQSKWLPTVDAIEADLARIHFHHTRWFADFRNGIDCSLPYVPGPNKAKIVRVDQYVLPKLREVPLNTPFLESENKKPEYVAMIPFYFPFNSKGPRLLEKLLKLIRDQAFDNNSNNTSDLTRLHVTILINRPYTLSPEENENFLQDVKAIKGLEGLNVHILASYWKTTWKSSFTIPHTYRLTPEDVRNFVKIISPSSLPTFDFKVRTAFFKVVPYLLLREELLKSACTHYYIENNTGPLYGVTWDADTLAFHGFLTHLDRHIERLSPDLISLGYGLPDTVPPLARLAAKIDMAIREETNAEGLGVYFPEPSTAYRLTPQQTYRFITTGQTVEGRRFVQAGLQNGTLREGHMFFKAESALVTTMPDRMFTETIRKTQSLNASLLLRKNIFQALRGFSQTHLNPHQWAENVYITLPIKAKKMTDITAPLMDIFKSCDVINRVYAQHVLNPTIIGVKNALISQKKLNLIKLKKQQSSSKRNLTPEELGLLEAQNLIYASALKKLQSMGLETTLIQKILRASAKSANRAIDLILESFQP